MALQSLVIGPEFSHKRAKLQPVERDVTVILKGPGLSWSIGLPSCEKRLISWQMSHLDYPEFIDEVICTAAFSMGDIGR